MTELNRIYTIVYYLLNIAIDYFYLVSTGGMFRCGSEAS